MNTEELAKRQERQVSQMTTQTQNVANRLKNLIVELETQLQPVLREAMPPEEKPEEVEPVLVPLAREIKGINETVFIMIGKIEDIITRLEI